MCAQLVLTLFLRDLDTVHQTKAVKLVQEGTQLLSDILNHDFRVKPLISPLGIPCFPSFSL